MPIPKEYFLTVVFLDGKPHMTLGNHHQAVDEYHGQKVTLVVPQVSLPQGRRLERDHRRR
jgi:hypothetical protein